MRRWTLGDIGCVEYAAQDPRITEAHDRAGGFSEEEGRMFLWRQLRQAEDGEGLSLAIAFAATNRALGLLWLAIRPQPDVAGIGYWVSSAERGRGVARRAAQLAASWALDTVGAARRRHGLSSTTTPRSGCFTLPASWAKAFDAQSWALAPAAPTWSCSPGSPATLTEGARRPALRSAGD